MQENTTRQHGVDEFIAAVRRGHRVVPAQPRADRAAEAQLTRRADQRVFSEPVPAGQQHRLPEPGVPLEPADAPTPADAGGLAVNDGFSDLDVLDARRAPTLLVACSATTYNAPARPTTATQARMCPMNSVMTNIAGYGAWTTTTPTAVCSSVNASAAHGNVAGRDQRAVLERQHLQRRARFDPAAARGLGAGDDAEPGGGRGLRRRRQLHRRALRPADAEQCRAAPACRTSTTASPSHGPTSQAVAIGQFATAAGSAIPRSRAPFRLGPQRRRTRRHGQLGRGRLSAALPATSPY